VLVAAILSAIAASAASGSVRAGPAGARGFDTELAGAPEEVRTAIVMLAGRDPVARERIGASTDRSRVIRAMMDRCDRAASAVDRALSEHGIRVDTVERLWAINAMIVRGSGRALLDLARLPEVEAVLPDRPRRLPPVRGRAARGREDAYTYGLRKMDVDKVHAQLALFGDGVVVGHLDTGIDPEHADLKGKVLAFRNFVVQGGGDAGAPVDDHGHGTHTAGTIAGGNTSGTAIGVAPKARLVVGKIFTGSGSSTDAAILAGMNWIADPDGNPDTADAPVVCSNSWGGSPGSEESEKPYWEMVRTWVRLGIFPCFAAGNEGPGVSSMGTPGGYPHAFSVGATDGADAIANFSSRGPITWSGTAYTKPEVSAPGVDVYSAKPGGGYQMMDGTSMATPHAAGLIALIYGVHPGWTIEQVSRLLQETATDLGPPGVDNTFGTGRLNAFAAGGLAVNGGKVQVRIVDESGQPLAGRVTVTGGAVTQVSASGTASLVLLAGTYTLVASAFGHHDSDPVTVQVVAGQTVEQAFVLRKAPEGRLLVTVTDEATNAPLPARVRALDTPVAEAEADPADGQVAIALPYGTYRIAVRAFAHEARVVEGVRVDAASVAVAVKLAHLPDVLLYDHDQGKPYEGFYRAALDALARPYTYYDARARGEADEETLLAYPIIVYFTGDDYRQTVPEPMRATLTRYLASGGRLLLTGQDIGYDLKSTPFYRDVVHARFIKDATSTRQVSGSGLAFSLEGGDGAGNQRYPDKIEVATPAGVTVLFDYGSEEGPAGLLVRGADSGIGTGAVAYLAFGFEGIDTAASRQKVMAELLARLGPGLREKAARLAALARLAGAAAADQYSAYVVDAYEREPHDRQHELRGLLRGLQPRWDPGR
jgi:bacillopeptidase F